MKQKIDINGWNRKEHFEFFSALDDPFFGITTNVDFTKIYLQSKEQHKPFFLYSVHFLLKCINECEAFKLRIEGSDVIKFDRIHVSPTIGKDDGTFGFGFFEYMPDLDSFIINAEKEINRVKNSSGLAFSPETGRIDLIRYSALPWFAFSEMKHATSFGNDGGVPRISTGKLTKNGERYMLPISICAHHGLMDGRNVAELLEIIEEMKR